MRCRSRHFLPTAFGSPGVMSSTNPSLLRRSPPLQGPPLAYNLRAKVLGKPLWKFKPQSSHLVSVWVCTLQPCIRSFRTPPEAAACSFVCGTAAAPVQCSRALRQSLHRSPRPRIF